MCDNEKKLTQAKDGVRYINLKKPWEDCRHEQWLAQPTHTLRDAKGSSKAKGWRNITFPRFSAGSSCCERVLCTKCNMSMHAYTSFFQLEIMSVKLVIIRVTYDNHNKFCARKHTKKHNFNHRDGWDHFKLFPSCGEETNGEQS